MKIKNLIIVAFLVVVDMLCFAQTGTDAHRLEITFPEDQDLLYAFGDTINRGYDNTELVIEFTGEISPDGNKIRVIWKSSDGKKTDDYTLSKYTTGETNFVYRVSKKLANLEYGTNTYRFIATFKDGQTREVVLQLFLLHGHVGERAKPVIYLYPLKETKIRVSVAPEGGVAKSIPEMGASWHVSATPNGNLTDLSDGKIYPYLFWESKDFSPPLIIQEGFVFSRTELEPKLKEVLALLGLNENETADLLDFWLPILTEKPFVYMHFYSMERIDREAPLSIDPRPDSIIRVYFEYKALDKPVAVRRQNLVPVTRHGYSVIEWGGRR